MIQLIVCKINSNHWGFGLYS